MKRSHETTRIEQRQKKKRGTRPARMEENSLRCGGSRLHLAAVRGIVERFPCDADYLVGVAFDAAQIDILDRVLRLGHRPNPTRAVDLFLLQRAVQSFLVPETAFDRGKAAGKQEARVVPLYCVHIGLHTVLFAIGVTELFVLGVLNPITVVQGRQQSLRGSALGFERSVGEKTAPVKRNLVLESRRGVIFGELDRAAASEKHKHRVGPERGNLGYKRRELDVG